MHLELENIVPDPLRESDLKDSEVWDKTLRIHPGERLFLRAPSGRGKSTLIHILYGLRKDYSGRVLWGGIDGNQQDADAWSEWRSRKISIVFQDLRLFDELTVAENLRIKQALTPETSMELAKEWVAMLGLRNKWEQVGATLSYGEKQRIAIIRALLQPFQWLLLDEPFSHLDRGNIQKATALIERRLEEQDAGLIMVDLEAESRFGFRRQLLL
jgi:putative ABC transport system ATP-binding protein